MERDDGEIESPAKKRRLSLNQPERSTSFATSLQHTRHKSGDVPLPPKGPNPGHMHPDDGDTIGISANSKLAGQTVIPFLAEHIPDQYAHSSNKMPATDQPANATPDPKYCYRHHPDLKCRRQADEPSMNQLQHVRWPDIETSYCLTDQIAGADRSLAIGPTSHHARLDFVFSRSCQAPEAHAPRHPLLMLLSAAFLPIE